MKRSPLHDQHELLNARMLPFAGWEMPIQYEGIVAEHQAVREKAGVFDISHMGEIVVSGNGAGNALNRLLTNDVSVLGISEGQYTLMLNEGGGVIDDLIVYRSGEESYFLVVNASRVEDDVAWIRKHLPESISLENRSDELGAIAVQGPESVARWNQLEPDCPLPPRNGIVEYDGGLILCRTGYTGEDGFELFAPNDGIGDYFRRLLDLGVIPCGLGARDTLRLEKAFPLNGSDLNEDRTPLEAGLGFFVKLDMSEGFIGAAVLREQKSSGLKEKLTAIAMTGKAPPPRHGYEVRDEEGETLLGELTSGSLSPGLGCGIGLAYLPVEASRIGSEVTIMIRDRPFPAMVAKKPFL